MSFGTFVSDGFKRAVMAKFRQDRTFNLMLPPVPGDPSTYFRASSIGLLCGRAEGLKIRDGVVGIEEIDPKLGFIFAKGHAYHDMHQQEILPLVAREGLLGWWSKNDTVLSESIDGNPVLFSRADAEARIGPDIRYEEVTVVDHRPMVWLSGHPDAVVDWSRVDFNHPDLPKGREIIEMKSREGAPWAWNAIDPGVGGAPKPQHRFQIYAYMMMLGIDAGRILYIRKSEKTGTESLESDYAEHRVQRTPENDQAIEAYMSKIWTTVIQAWEGEIAPRTKCGSKSDSTAQKCKHRHACFGTAPRSSFRGIKEMNPVRFEAMKAIAAERIAVLREAGYIP